MSAKGHSICEHIDLPTSESSRAALLFWLASSCSHSLGTSVALSRRDPTWRRQQRPLSPSHSISAFRCPLSMLAVLFGAKNLCSQLVLLNSLSDEREDSVTAQSHTEVSRADTSSSSRRASQSSAQSPEFRPYLCGRRRVGLGGAGGRGWAPPSEDKTAFSEAVNPTQKLKRIPIKMKTQTPRKHQSARWGWPICFPAVSALASSQLRLWQDVFHQRLLHKSQLVVGLLFQPQETVRPASPGKGPILQDYKSLSTVMWKVSHRFKCYFEPVLY